MTRTSSAHASEGRGFGAPAITWWPLPTASWMGAAFLVASALAVMMLVIFGVGERGTAIALRATARWSFLLFWLAYAGGAIAWLCGPRLGGLARHGRDLGLAFASAQLVHVGLVLWIIHVATRPRDREEDMNELRRSEGKAQVAPVARQAAKPGPAQPCDRAAGIGEPEQEKGPSRRRPQGDRRTPLSDAENNEHHDRQRRRNQESRPHPRRRWQRPPSDRRGTEPASLRRMGRARPGHATLL